MNELQILLSVHVIYRTLAIESYHESALF